MVPPCIGLTTVELGGIASPKPCQTVDYSETYVRSTPTRLLTEIGGFDTRICLTLYFTCLFSLSRANDHAESRKVRKQQAGRQHMQGGSDMSARDRPSELPPAPAPVEELDYSVRLALLAAIVESSDDAIVSKTLEGRILSWNAGAARIFGYTAEEAIGQPITIIIPPELREEERRILEQVRHGKRVDHFDTTRVTKDGRQIAISLTVSPVRDSRGVIVGASKVARDITERKRSEEALRESERRLKASEEALRDADRRKDEFLALLAHELRNSLAPIRYALAANKKPGRTPEQLKRSEEIMERQVTHMSRLLDDLLDVARITRSTLDLKKTPTELTFVVGSAIDTARPVLEAKNHTLSLDLPKHPCGWTQTLCAWHRCSRTC